MKRSLALLILVAAFSSCSSLSLNSSIMKIQKGMTREDVTQLLGNPDYRRFDEAGEQWEYFRVGSSLNNIRILVEFIDGQVSNLDSFNDKSCQTPVVAVCPPAEVGPVILPADYPDRRRPQSRIMSESIFQQFYQDVKNKTFKDSQLEQISTGSIHNSFTCDQVIRLMSIFNFDDEKIEVLEILVDRIADKDNYTSIVKSFTFISSKEKAELLLPRYRPIQHPTELDEFERLYNDVKNATFKDEQLRVLARGIDRNRFTCNQCVRLMSIFNFDDEKMKVVEMLAERLTDKVNKDTIINALSFISSKDKAKELLQRSRW